MKKFVCFSASFSGNKGASAMLESAIENLTRKFPDSIFYVFSPFPKIDKKNNSYANVVVCSGTPLALVFRIFPLSFLSWLFKKVGLSVNLGREINNIKEADAVLDLSGISFSDGRELFLPFNILCILPAIFLNKKVIKCSQALGNFNNFINRFLARMILSKVSLIIARGRYTKEFLDQLKLNNVILGADLAFSLSTSEEMEKQLKKKFYDDFFWQREVVGISPSSIVKKNCQKIGIDYTKELANFIDYLIEQNYHVLIIPHSFSRKNNKKFNNLLKELYSLLKHPRSDLSVCQDIYYLIKHKEASWLIEEDLTARQLRILIGWCSFFLTSRFHPMISALSMKVPVLVCGWGHKYSEVLEIFGLGNYSFDYKNLSPRFLIKKFEELVKNKLLITEKIDNKLFEVVNSSKKYLEYIN